MTDSGSNIRYVIMKFDDRNRFGQNGIPANVLFTGGERVIVYMKDATLDKAGKRNRFAKVAVKDTVRGKEAELIELLGEVGTYAAELEAYQLHFGGWTFMGLRRRSAAQLVAELNRHFS